MSIAEEQSGARILVIDDEEIIRSTFQSLLEHSGFSVVTAEEYAAAVSRLAEREFDLVLTDIMLGGKTGVDLLRTVRELQPHCPVVMMTGYPTLETAEEGLRLGAFDYLRKPVTYESLIEVVRRALQHRQKLTAQIRHRTTLEAIVRSVPDGIIAVDERLRVLDMNESAAAHCGPPTGPGGRPLALAERRCSGRCDDVIRAALARRSPVEGVCVECSHAEDPGLAVTVSAYPFPGGKDTPTGGVMVMRHGAHRTAGDAAHRRRSGSHAIVGTSTVMQKLYALIEVLADVQTTVLITGESGTGKELVAQALHAWGGRAHKPLVRVNCAALSDNLLESELFGHVRGAFTGAVRDKIGRFEKAHEGTLFLDEIGDISPNLQVRLLRVLQEREFERVGDSTPIRVDVRVVLATNRDLAALVRQGAFREDLYYRLKVVELGLPPLRERTADIPLLVDHFIRKFNRQFSKSVEAVSPDVLDLLLAYPWPGNVRELEHAMEYAFIRSKGSVIAAASLPAGLNRTPVFAQGAAPHTAAAGERDTLLKALEKSFWNKTKAAELLGMSRRTIYRKIREHNISLR